MAPLRRQAASRRLIRARVGGCNGLDWQTSGSGDHRIQPIARGAAASGAAASQGADELRCRHKVRRAAGWKRTSTDADAAANGSREAIRNLARDFVRNRPYAARYVDVVATNVVGTGIQFSVRHKDLDKGGQIDAVLRQHFGTTDIDSRGECDLAQMQRIVFRGVVVDGEILARRHIRVGPFGRNLKLWFQIEVIEADHLDQAVVSWGQNVVIEESVWPDRRCRSLSSV